jgi:DNA-binding transcriptional LysR family regulator
MDNLSTPELTRWLRFKHLNLLVVLGEYRNMHLAAQQMHLSQPAASKMLKDLEAFFGFKIFDRLPRSMQPTDLGLHVLRHAQVLLNDVDRLVDDIFYMREGGYGQLLIGVIPAAAPEILPAAIIALKQRIPRLRVSVQEHSSDRLLTDLEHKRLDLVVGRLTRVDQHNIFDFEALLEEPLCIVVRKEHPLAERDVVKLGDLHQWPWVLHPLNSPMRGIFEKALEVAGIASPTNVIETTSIQVTFQLLETSDMLAVLPRSVLRRSVEKGLLVRLPLQIGQPLNYYGIITRKHEKTPPGVAELISALRAQISPPSES